MTINPWLPGVGRPYPPTEVPQWSYPTTTPPQKEWTNKVLLGFMAAWGSAELPDKLDQHLTCDQRSSLSDLLQLLGCTRAHNAWESKTCHACEVADGDTDKS